MADEVENKKKSSKTSRKRIKLVEFSVLISKRIGSNTDGTAKEVYVMGSKISLHPVNDKKKIEKLKILKII